MARRVGIGLLAAIAIPATRAEDAARGGCLPGAAAISGDRIMELTGLPPGPRVGEIRRRVSEWALDNRVEDPAWRKPDWAFVEEGKPVPKNAADRIEYGTLGEYALYLEDGYMIHGTLYERLLGRSVSHGCVRVGRDDLRVFWKGAPIGTPVYIF